MFRSSQCNAEANELNNEMDEDSAALEARFADKVKTLELAKKHLQEVFFEINFLKNKFLSN